MSEGIFSMRACRVGKESDKLFTDASVQHMSSKLDSNPSLVGFVVGLLFSFIGVLHFAYHKSYKYMCDFNNITV